MGKRKLNPSRCLKVIQSNMQQYIVYNINTEDRRRTAIDIAAYRYKDMTGTVKTNCMTEIRQAAAALGLDCCCRTSRAAAGRLRQSVFLDRLESVPPQRMASAVMIARHTLSD